MFKIKLNFIYKKNILLCSVYIILFQAFFPHKVLCKPVLSLTDSGSYTFTLKNSANTSAGVYFNDVLVRTLWTNVTYEAGIHPIYWDGKDDSGNALSPSTYTVKVLANNLIFNWLGGIGNTSSNFTGTSVHHAYGVPISVCAVGNKIYYATGYSEVSPSIYSFITSAPQVKVDVVPYGTTTKTTDHLCTDGVRLYMSGFDSWKAPAPSYVSAITVSDNSKYTFSSGNDYAQANGGGYTESAICYSDIANGLITGISVQQSHNYLFVSRASLNTLYVLNKITGALVKTITSFTNPKELCVDKSDNLWISYKNNTVEKFIVNIDGSLSSTGVTLSGITKPGAITVTTDGNKIQALDYNDSKTYFYSAANGTQISIFGQGNYALSSMVSNDKFALKGYNAAISYVNDGSFWITDGGNTRLQHFDSNQNFIESVQFQPPVYSTNVDNGNTGNIFGNYLEYSVDYDKIISGNTGWNFTNNWGEQISANYNTFEGFKSVHTFTVGNIKKVFAFLRVNAYPRGYELIELQANGNIRFTGIIKDGYIIDESGALILGDGQIRSDGGSAMTKKYSFTGSFDTSNNPAWNFVPEILADFSGLDNTKDQQLLLGNNASMRNFVTADNKVIVYQPGVWVSGNPANGYLNCNHLGALAKNGNSFLWQTAKGTSSSYRGSFPDPSCFDIGNSVNNYAGSSICVQGNIIVAGYHGEFWKGGQTNKYNVYYSDGLALGQFGTTTYDSYGEAPAGLAGNALTPQLIKTTNNRLILWHGDESRSGKIQAWEIIGENSINEQSITIVYPNPILSAPQLAGVDLMTGLVAGNILQDGQYGWKRSNIELKTSKKTFSANVGSNLYSGLPNLNITYRIQDANSNIGITRTLENSSALNSWKLSGKLNWDLNAPNDTFMLDGINNCNGSYIEILDDQAKIIARFYTTYTITGGYKRQIIGNDKTLINDTEANIRLIQNNIQPFSISVVDKNITFNYAEYSQTTNILVNQSANISKPTTLRFYFYQNYNGTQSNDKYVNVSELRFFKKVSQNIIFNNISSKHFGDIPFVLNAISTSNLPITYTMLSGPAKVIKNIVTITGVGKVVIQATQAGNDVYDTATPVVQSFIVGPMRVDL